MYKRKRIVIALGGNALGNTLPEQMQAVKTTARALCDLIEEGHQVVVVHGNGPQVGMINLGMATAAEAKAIKSDMPFPECGAMSQGYIGYHLQNAIGNELASRGMNKDVATVVTQVLVDEADPAFQHPTKPVGAFYDKETADRIAAEKGYTMVEDAGRGYRQVVPSPKPIDVIEKNTVKALVDNGTVVITVGGGGIPVVCRDGKLYGTPAVIDKDFASAKLAELLDADMLVILTAVEKVAINFGKPDQKGLLRASPAASRSSRCLRRQPRASKARPAPACRCKSRQTFLKRVRFEKRALFFVLSPLWTKIHAAFLVKFDPHFFFFLLINFPFLCIMVITVFKSFDCRKI